VDVTTRCHVVRVDTVVETTRWYRQHEGFEYDVRRPNCTLNQPATFALLLSATNVDVPSIISYEPADKAMRSSGTLMWTLALNLEACASC
jgi:hypothetical protein